MLRTAFTALAKCRINNKAERHLLKNTNFCFNVFTWLTSDFNVHTTSLTRRPIIWSSHLVRMFSSLFIKLIWLRVFRYYSFIVECFDGEDLLYCWTANLVSSWWRGCLISFCPKICRTHSTDKRIIGHTFTFSHFFVPWAGDQVYFYDIGIKENREIGLYFEKNRKKGTLNDKLLSDPIQAFMANKD